MKNCHKSKWVESEGCFYTIVNPRIRYKIVIEDDDFTGKTYTDYLFEIFTRPYFFGLIGKRRWEMSVQTNGFYEGVSFSLYLLNK